MTYFIIINIHIFTGHKYLYIYIYICTCILAVDCQDASSQILQVHRRGSFCKNLQAFCKFISHII